MTRFLQELMQNWKFWVIASLVLTSSSAAFALAVLLRLPGLPNCPAVFWPLASAGLRFECARLAASKQTMKDLLEAIALVDSLPPNHEMREEADRLIQLWSEDVLELADVAFNEGKLQEAIAAARKIPPSAAASKVVEARVKRWQEIWTLAEGYYRKAEAELRKLNWRGAFDYGVRLLSVENRYWQTTKYDELGKRIETARQDGNKLFKAERLAEEGGLENLLEAIKLASEIDKKSYVYQEAQKSIDKFGRQLLVLAEDAMERKEFTTALRILDRVPERGKLKEEAKDLSVLASAQSHAAQNSVSGLEEAISEAQRISAKRPLYQKAQQLISRWQLELEAVAKLEKARSLAVSGAPQDLAAAIAQANQVADSNPRRAEADREIATWTGQIETMQDRPLLDQADRTAAPGDLNSLQSAIAQANQIARGRALYGEAQDRIAQWTTQVDRIQDQPLLDRARQFAYSGNLQAAIDTANQIRGGGLYEDAQAEIDGWRKQIQAEVERAKAPRYFQEAQQLANSGTVEGYLAAIDRADQIAATSEIRADATAAINQWSWQILQIAQSQAAANLPNAISLAERIPSGTDAYNAAQQQLQVWRQSSGGSPRL
jgi:hypothetical protein